MLTQLGLWPEYTTTVDEQQRKPSRTGLAGFYILWDELKHRFKMGRADNIDRRLAVYETHNPGLEPVRFFELHSVAVRVMFETRAKRATLAYLPMGHKRTSEWRRDDPRVLDIVDRLALKLLGMDVVRESEAHVRRLHASAEWQARLRKLAGDDDEAA